MKTNNVTFRVAPVKHSVFRTDIQPFFLWLAWLLGLTLVMDYLLHDTGAFRIERHLGIVGTCLLVLSFAYSLRKRKIITFGKLRDYLRMHEYLAWTGSLMVFTHGGVHFNAILPWAATAAMLVAVISGLVGKYLLKQATDTLSNRKVEFAGAGLSSDEMEKRIFWDALAVSAMKKWKSVHKPITIIFALSAVLHIFIILLFRGWK